MKKYIENTGRNVIFAGGKMIPPGEGREIDVPDIQAEAAGEPLPDTDAPLLELLLGSVRAIADQLAGLGDGALERMAVLESQTETPRKTLLTAIDAEQLRRANEALEKAEAMKEATEGLAAARAALAAETDPEKQAELQHQVAEMEAFVAELGIEQPKD